MNVFKGIGKWAFQTGLQLTIALLGAFVITQQWAWFVTPMVGFQINMALAYGFLVFINLLQTRTLDIQLMKYINEQTEGHLDADGKKEKGWTDFWINLSVYLIIYLGSWFTGWIVTMFGPAIIK
jgi:hypothetical protein